MCVDITVREGERDCAIAIFEDSGERRVRYSGEFPDVSLHPERIGEMSDTSNTSMLNLSSLTPYRP